MNKRWQTSLLSHLRRGVRHGKRKGERLFPVKEGGGGRGAKGIDPHPLNSSASLRQKKGKEGKGSDQGGKGKRPSYILVKKKEKKKKTQSERKKGRRKDARLSQLSLLLHRARRGRKRKER